MRKGAPGRENPAFGRWLRAELDRHDMNQSEFAKRAGVSTSTVSRWVHGRVPEAELIDAIADALFLDYDIVSTKAGYRPKTLLEVEPDSPTARIMGYVERIDWSEPGRIEGLIAQLETYLKIDEMRKQQS